MAHSSFLIILKLMLLFIFSSWVLLWILKQTEFWTRTWKKAEEKVATSALRYNGLDYIVYTFPMIALAITGFIYLDLKTKESRSRQGERVFTCFSSPLVVNGCIGILSGLQILASSAFIIFLVWTFYNRISNDFEKMRPIKSFKLVPWQFKLFRIYTRCGLLAEACLAMLLLPVLRGMSIFRLLGIQFEASVRYHIWLGNAMLFFATLHGAGTYFIWGLNHRIQDEMWKWQSKGRIYLAGEMALITGLIIWATALPPIRRKWFELFYYTHHLYIFFLVLFLFHGGDRHFYMVFPGFILFALDKLFRILQSRKETCIISVRAFPCGAMELILPKNPRLTYTPTSILFVKIPSISKFQWHPFSVTSGSSIDEYTISIIIKREGNWTNSLYRKVHAEANSESKCIPVATEGPYGPAILDFLRYENMLLIAGGIGITPFLSILQERGFNLRNGRNTFPDKIQLVYIVKKSREVCLLNSVLPQILDFQKFKVKVKIFVTQENQRNTSLCEILSELDETKMLEFSTNCLNYGIDGPERLPWMAAITMITSVVFLLFLSCFNHFFIQPTKKPTGWKNPSSSLTDLFLVCSFAIAIAFSALVATIAAWKTSKKNPASFSEKHKKTVKQESVESNRSFQEHEIHFGGRPNFHDIFSNFARESGESDIGVLVCGPEAMKESVASLCKVSSLFSKKNDKKTKPSFCFQALNFTL